MVALAKLNGFLFSFFFIFLSTLGVVFQKLGELLCCARGGSVISVAIVKILLYLESRYSQRRLLILFRDLFVVKVFLPRCKKIKHFFYYI